MNAFDLFEGDAHWSGSPLHRHFIPDARFDEPGTPLPVTCIANNGENSILDLSPITNEVIEPLSESPQ